MMHPRSVARLARVARYEASGGTKRRKSATRLVPCDPARHCHARHLPLPSPAWTEAIGGITGGKAGVPGIAGSLLASAMALQLLTERLARARGVDPDTIGREDAAQAAAHA